MSQLSECVCVCLVFVFNCVFVLWWVLWFCSPLESEMQDKDLKAGPVWDLQCFAQLKTQKNSELGSLAPSLRLWIQLFSCTPSVTGRAKLCGRFWSIATMEMSKPAQEETAWPPSATARWLREAPGNHPQVCKTMCHHDGEIEMTDLLKLGHCRFKLYVQKIKTKMYLL